MTIDPMHTPASPLPEPSPPGDALPASRDAAPPTRRIRSFVKRAGRSGTGQARAREALGPQFVLPYAAAPLDWDAAFGRRGARRVLEIGFGMGDATARIAAAHPEWDILGIEVHEPGIGALLRHIGDAGLGNLRIVAHDAVDVLDHMIGVQALDAVFIFFPDPWPKKRHHKRRLIQPPFVARLARHLKPGGLLHCATDWQDYAEQMAQVLDAEPLLQQSEHQSASGRPLQAKMRPEWRPETKFERRGVALGHGVWDLVYQRRA